MRLRSRLAVLAAASWVALAPAGASAAPLPFFAVDCAQKVRAFRDQPVELSRLAVSGLVTRAVRETPGLGPARATAAGVAFQLGPALPVGVVPDGSAEIAGADIAEVVAAVVRPMPEVAPAAEEATARVRALVAESCGMDVRALDATGEPGPTPPPGGPAPGAPGGGGDPATTPNTQPVGGYAPPDGLSLYDPASFGRAQPRDYATVPAAPAGLFVPGPDARYGGVPGYSPQFGLLGGYSDVEPAAAGDLRALPTGGGAVALPVLLAVLALAGLAGALVRTWVLRGV